MRYITSQPILKEREDMLEYMKSKLLLLYERWSLLIAS